MKKSFLFGALLASLALVGCGGGGGSSSPVAPQVVIPNQAVVAGSVVAPIANNAQSILNYAPVTSSRLSSSNTDGFDFDNVSTNVQTALKANKVLASFLRANGADGVLAGQFDNSLRYEEISSFNNNVFERKVYKDIATSRNNPNNYLIYCKIENCKGNLDSDGVLKSFSINKDAAITVDDVKGGVKFSGTVNTDFRITAISKTYQDTGVVTLGGDEYNGYEYNKEIKVTNVFSVGDLSLNLTSIEIKDNFDYEHQTYNGVTKGTNVALSISGLDETSYSQDRTIYSDGQYVKKVNGNWVRSEKADCCSKMVVSDESDIDLKLQAPVQITLSGDITHTGKDTNKTTTGKIKSLVLKVTKLSEDNESTYGYNVDRAEAHLDIQSVSTTEKIKVGNQEIAFNWAKLDVTNIQYKDSWKSLDEVDRRKNIFGSSVASFTSEEINNKVLFHAKYDVANKKITGKLNNNGSYIVKDKEKLLQFDFKTVDITGTNVRIVELGNCEGASFVIKGTERDDVVSTRTYMVQNEKFVLVDASDKPSVIVPEEIPLNAYEVTDAVEAASLVDSGVNQNLKLGSDGDIKYAAYKKEASGDNKEIDTSVMAKDTVLYAVSYYGNDVYTIVFALDNSNSKIKGIILEGKNTSATLETTDKLIGTFSGIKNNCISVITTDGNSYNIAIR